MDPSSPATPPEPQRLSKIVAAMVPCSRSEAEQYIAEGRVRVNGKVVEEPQRRVAGERVEIDAQSPLQAPDPATMLMHKPPGMSNAQALALLNADNRWQGDTSGIRRIKSHATGLVPLLALPVPAEGLTVFSQDGRILRKLREDANVIEQELVAEVVGTIAANGLARLCNGSKLEGRPLPPARVSWQSETRLRFALKGIPPEMIEWMCAQVGLRLTGLRRLRIGRVPMAGLPPGQWRYLAPGEKF